mmetsp:Transcript_5616/g.21243  ORF Transcript_5616/g.21243 Transcript_5616/m.21243 type:complete len:254 (+) Transcript_5616:29-790(+)
MAQSCVQCHSLSPGRLTTILSRCPPFVGSRFDRAFVAELAAARPSWARTSTGRSLWSWCLIMAPRVVLPSALARSGRDFSVRRPPREASRSPARATCRWATSARRASTAGSPSASTAGTNRSRRRHRRKRGRLRSPLSALRYKCPRGGSHNAEGTRATTSNSSTEMKTARSPTLARRGACIASRRCAARCPSTSRPWPGCRAGRRCSGLGCHSTSSSSTNTRRPRRRSAQSPAHCPDRCPPRASSTLPSAARR